MITHYDLPKDKEYAEGDIIITFPEIPRKAKAFYNLYCNKLLQAIPDGAGWCHFIDDDDKYTALDVISRLVNNAKKDCVNVGRSKRTEEKIWPKRWGLQTSFQTECFFLHTDHKGKAKWWDKKGGDHYYSAQLTEMLEINWIDDLIICSAMAGKGLGKRRDYSNQKIIDKFNARFSGLLDWINGTRKF